MIIPNIWKNKIHVPNQQPANEIPMFLGLITMFQRFRYHPGGPTTGDAGTKRDSTVVTLVAALFFRSSLDLATRAMRPKQNIYIMGK